MKTAGKTENEPMIADERMVAFINSFDKGNTPFLDEIEKYARETEVPIIRKQMQSLLRFLLAFFKPGKILEVGTAIGFSALLMSEYAPVGCRITTIEKYEKRIPIARENFKRAGKEGQIELLEGDAVDILRNLDESYDLIFMDAAKGQYINFLPDILRLLAPGGLLVSDNVLQDGEIIESRFAVTRRNRTIHTRMREYLYELTHHPQLETCILPVGDGVTLSTKVGAGEEEKLSDTGEGAGEEEKLSDTGEGARKEEELPGAKVNIKVVGKVTDKREVGQND